MNETLERFVTGPIDTNTYVLANDAKECIIIDPSSGCGEVLSYIRENRLNPLAILITHGHFDHIGGIPEIIGHYPTIRLLINPAERSSLVNPHRNMSMLLGMSFSYDGDSEPLEEGKFSIGGFSGTVYYVPGHSPGGSALYIAPNLLCGDILFAGSVGRTDFEGGDHAKLVCGIISKLMPLPDDTVVCPGHGGRTTIGRERRMNPYLNGMAQ